MWTTRTRSFKSKEIYKIELVAGLGYAMIRTLMSAKQGLETQVEAEVEALEVQENWKAEAEVQEIF